MAGTAYIAEGNILSGRYRADALLQEGGMGALWRCRDLELGRDVAVKVVRREFLAAPWADRLFRGEVAAIARLNHRGIIPVYDLITQGGAAYLVMEYRPCSTLRELVDATTWQETADVIEQILEILSFAHARGVLHLDIKPENVLVERRAGGDGRAADRLDVTLIDFGLARVKTPRAGERAWLEGREIAGTPAYMAPEQLLGDSVRFGPATDLYAAGVVAFELCTGARPFGEARNPEARAPACWLARSDVPVGVREWIAWLLAAEPRDRPLCGADALYALREIRGAGPAPASSRPRRARVTDARALAPTVTAPPAEELPHAAPSCAEPLDRWAATRQGAAIRAAASPASVELPRELPGAYGMYGLRDLPVLGRDREREALWRVVIDTVHLRRPRVVLVEGAPGVGKSRLARDAVERAAELGLCLTMQTAYSSQGASDEGLRGAIESLLDTRGADAAQLRARLDFWLDRQPADHAALRRDVELLLRPPPLAAPDAALPMRVLGDLLACASQLRPVALWLDDIHWNWHEAHTILEQTLSRDLPICVIATMRDTEIPDPAAYAALRAHPSVVRIQILPLDGGATRHLVRGLLDVDESLCELIERRAEGIPLFATQLMDQLARSGALERVGGRYRLVESWDLAAIPADIGALWERRLARSGADRHNLAAIALVRDRVSLDVMGHLLAVAGRGMEADVARALDAGLVRLEGGAYAWSHGLLREHLLATIAPADRPALHGLAAAALAPLVPAEDVQAERAHHLRGAGRIAEACAALLEAGRTSQRRAENRHRRDRFTLLHRWASEAGLVGTSARALAELAHLDVELGDRASAGRRIAAALAEAQGADGESQSWVLLRKAHVELGMGRTAEGVEASEQALAAARARGVPAVEAGALLSMGIAAQRAGDVARARAVLGEAMRMARLAGEPAQEAQALWTAALLEAPAEGLPMCERAVALASSIGALRFALMGRQVWVDLLWRVGERARARREALAVSKEAVRLALRQTVSLVALQSSCWAWEEDDHAEARAHHESARRWGAAEGSSAERANFLALDLVLALREGRDAAAREALVMLQGMKRAYWTDDLAAMVAGAAELAPAELAEALRAL